MAPNEIEGLIGSISRIDQDQAVRSRGSVYAVRNLMQLSPEIRDLADSPKVRSIVNAQVSNDGFPVRGTLFDKTTTANWLVPWHQYVTIRVVSRVDVEGYGPWTWKAGVCHVQLPAAISGGMLSLRIHLDDCDEPKTAVSCCFRSQASRRQVDGKTLVVTRRVNCAAVGNPAVLGTWPTSSRSTRRFWDESNGALRVLAGTARLGRLTGAQIAGEVRTQTGTVCVARAGDVVLKRPLLAARFFGRFRDDSTAGNPPAGDSRRLCDETITWGITMGAAVRTA